VSHKLYSISLNHVFQTKTKKVNKVNESELSKNIENMLPPGGQEKLRLDNGTVFRDVLPTPARFWLHKIRFGGILT